MGCKTMCVICLKNVDKRSHALQCDTCDSWTHAKCENMSSALYAHLRDLDSLLLKIECIHCRNRRLNSDCVTASESDSESDADVTCIPAAPPSDSTTCCSTPKTSSKPAEMERLIDSNSAQHPKSYAEITATTVATRNRSVPAAFSPPSSVNNEQAKLPATTTAPRAESSA